LEAAGRAVVTVSDLTGRLTEALEKAAADETEWMSRLQETPKPENLNPKP
jgi:hypothetical protein